MAIKPFSIKPAGTALLVIDMQNVFVAEGAAYECHGARTAIPRINRLIDVCHSLGIPVIYTVYSIRPDGSDAGILNELFPEKQEEVCGQGTWGEQFYQGIQPVKGDFIVTKKRYDGFYGTDLELLLRNKNVDTIIVTGGATDVCCASTVFGAFSRDIKAVFVSDCNAPALYTDGLMPPEEKHKAILAIIGESFGQVMTAEEVINTLQSLTKVQE